MKRKIFYKAFLCLFILTASLFLWSCSDDTSQETAAIDPIEITITIDYPAKAKLSDIQAQTFRVEENSSALQIIELYGNVNEISVLVDTTNATLEGIQGIISHVYGKNWEWKYKVNGDLKNKAIDDYIIKDGDHLEFIYTRTK